MRCERATAELEKLRGGSLPNFEAEEQLAAKLAEAQQQRAALERELSVVARRVLEMAGEAAHAGSGGRGGSSVIASEDGVQLELGTPRPTGGGAADAAAGAPADVGARMLRALGDITAQQAAASRTLEDQQQQIRLLKEASKLQRLRRASAAVTARP